MVSYQKIAQAGGYEVTRAQFEAYIGHSKDRANPSTGVIYWMMNKAWPSLQWNLYNYDFDQAGVYFGAKKANEPLHIMYDYHDGSIKVANLKGERQSGLQVTAEFVDIDGSIERAIQTRVRLLPPQDIHTVATPSEPHGISTTYFLKLVLHRGRQIFSRNVYWLSTKGDRVDWKKTLGRGSGAVMEADGYADLTGLHDLRSATVQARANTRIDGNEAVTTVKLRNTSDGHTPAFFARVDVHRSKSYGTLDNGDNQILPIRWNDNDVTFWPGEDLTLTGRYHRSRVKGIQPVVSIAGWNVSDQVIPAPKT
jgi:exo-1,4-beta-D-glucosaminidase